MPVQIPTYKYLAFAGTLPFIVSTVIILSPLADTEWITWSNLALHSYGLVIVTFMCGIHWGLYLTNHQQCPINLLIISNTITLICWFAYLSQHATLILASQLCAFLILVTLDAYLHKRDILHRDYYETRRSVTAVVSLILSINLLT